MSRPFQTWIESSKTHLVDVLRHAVAIPSVSGDPAHRDDVFAMAKWLQTRMDSLGVASQSVEMGNHTVDGQVLPLPPVLLGRYGTDAALPTVLVYGHYDVQPASKSDGWNTEPFVLTESADGEILYGRGSTDDKGPLLAWLAVIEAHQKTDTPMPVNLVMCFEGMEESGSEGLEELVVKESKPDGFFAGVDVVCISDNYWLGTSTPCITYGLRGLSYFAVTVKGPAADLHSGVFGGTVHEPMTDLFSVFSKLVTPAGEILIPGIKDLVAPLTAEEKARYDVIDITVKDIESAIGAQVTISEDKSTMLMARMRYPSLSIHGIEGAFSGVGAKTVIPCRAVGKFSIRLVPDLTPEATEKLVKEYLDAEFAKLNSKNSFTVEMLSGGSPWVADINHYNYRAATKATQVIYNTLPDMTREGGSIPITLTFAEALNKSVLLLPMGRGNDGAHSTNEKLDLNNYIQGTKLLGEYLHQVAAMKV